MYGMYAVRVYSKKKEIAARVGQRGLVYKKASKKMQKLSPAESMHFLIWFPMTTSERRSNLKEKYLLPGELS